MKPELRLGTSARYLLRDMSTESQVRTLPIAKQSRRGGFKPLIDTLYETKRTGLKTFRVPSGLISTVKERYRSKPVQFRPIASYPEGYPLKLGITLA